MRCDLHMIFGVALCGRAMGYWGERVGESSLGPGSHGWAAECRGAFLGAEYGFGLH
jgi:hypothetical protein